MIGIVDYGLGNIRAFENIYRHLGINAKPVKTTDDLQAASKIILPGVGAFDWAMERLTASGMLDALNVHVLDKRKPVLGVCVGMQIMARSSEEGRRTGLGWISGKVVRFDETLFNQRTHLPHMGWNDVDVVSECPLFRKLEKPRYYFLHSYHLDLDEDAAIVGYATYGSRFVCAIARGNVFATQFHPEKSHDWGVTLLKNFAEHC